MAKLMRVVNETTRQLNANQHANIFALVVALSNLNTLMQGNSRAIYIKNACDDCVAKLPDAMAQNFAPASVSTCLQSIRDELPMLQALGTSLMQIENQN